MTPPPEPSYPPPPGVPNPPPGMDPWGPLPPGFYFDPQSGLVLPNGTILAPVARRIGAFFLSILLLIVTLVIGYIVWGLIVWARGQTPALQVLGMRCWQPETGRVPGWGWMAIREIGGTIANHILSPISTVGSFVLLVVTRQHKALHDFIAGTVVLHDPDKVLA